MPDDRWSDFSDAQGGGASLRGYLSGRAAPRAALFILCLHLIFEYLRLHDILPILDQLKVQTAVSVALLGIVLAQTGKAGGRLTRQSWLLLGFLGLTVFTILPATNNFYAYQFSYSLTLILIGYFAITHILQNEQDLNRFLSLLLGIHIYIALTVILNYRPSFDEAGYLREFRAGSSFLGDENDVALAMVLILPFALYLFRQARSAAGRLFWGTGGVAILLSIVFTHSRGGFVGLMAMALCFVATNRNKKKAIGALVFAASVVLVVAPSQYWKRIETISDTDSGTAQLRRYSWAAARRMFYDSPIWGVGGYNFGVSFPDYALEFSEESRPNQWGRVTHSMYFELLAEFGLIGVFLIGSVLLWNFRDLREVRSLSEKGDCSASVRQLADCLRLSWVGFLVPAAFLSVLLYPHLYYLTALTVVGRRLAFAEPEEARTEPIGALETTGG